MAKKVYIYFLLFNYLSLRIFRFDAKKLLIYYRRPIPKDVKDIGRWTNILETLTIVSVYVNALLIAMTSDFIPQIVYRNGFNPNGVEWSGDGSLRGRGANRTLLNFTMSVKLGHLFTILYYRLVASASTFRPFCTVS